MWAARSQVSWDGECVGGKTACFLGLPLGPLDCVSLELSGSQALSFSQLRNPLVSPLGQPPPFLQRQLMMEGQAWWEVEGR